MKFSKDYDIAHFHHPGTYHLSTKTIYPIFTEESVEKAKNAIKRKHGRLDVITLDYYLREKRYGGLGYGKLKKVI